MIFFRFDDFSSDGNFVIIDVQDDKLEKRLKEKLENYNNHFKIIKLNQA